MLFSFCIRRKTLFAAEFPSCSGTSSPALCAVVRSEFLSFCAVSLLRRRPRCCDHDAKAASVPGRHDFRSEARPRTDACRIFTGLADTLRRHCPGVAPEHGDRHRPSFQKKKRAVENTTLFPEYGRRFTLRTPHKKAPQNPAQARSMIFLRSSPGRIPRLLSLTKWMKPMISGR